MAELRKTVEPELTYLDTIRKPVIRDLYYQLTDEIAAAVSGQIRLTTVFSDLANCLHKAVEYGKTIPK